MEDKARFTVIAEAASIMSRMYDGVPDRMIAAAVSEVASRAMEASASDEDFTVMAIAAEADHGLSILVVGSGTLRILSLQVDRDDLTPDTELASLGLDDGAIETLKGGLSEQFGVRPDEIDFSAATTVSDLIEQIVEIEVEDDQEGACSHGVCGCAGNTSAYKERQDADIARLGVTLAPVLPGNDGPGFVYSLGMSEQGKTDLLFIGDFTPPTYDYLSLFLGMQIDGKELPLGLFPADHPANGFEVPIWVIPADEKLGTHAFGAVTRLERIGSDKPAKLAQVVMPDKQNLFPWDDGYDWIDQQVSTSPATLN
jgi:acyl carrier protein